MTVDESFSISQGMVFWSKCIPRGWNPQISSSLSRHRSSSVSATLLASCASPPSCAVLDLPFSFEIDVSEKCVLTGRATTNRGQSCDNLVSGSGRWNRVLGGRQ